MCCHPGPCAQNKDYPDSTVSFPVPERHYPAKLKHTSWAAQVSYIEEDLAISMLFRLVAPAWKTHHGKSYGKYWVHGDHLKNRSEYRACHTTGRCRGEHKIAMAFEPGLRIHS